MVDWQMTVKADKTIKSFCLHGGAKVNTPSQNTEEDTPLHTAARFGVPELVALYLANGATVDAINSLQETPLMTAVFWAMDTKEQTYSQDHHLVCRLLLDHKAGEAPWYETFTLILRTLRHVCHSNVCCRSKPQR